MAGQASSNVPMKIRVAHHLLKFVLRIFFFSERLNDLVSEFMERLRNVSDWVGSRGDVSHFMAKPSCCKRSSIS